jgi:hypothetical protein
MRVRAVGRPHTANETIDREESALKTEVVLLPTSYMIRIVIGLQKWTFPPLL